MSPTAPTTGLYARGAAPGADSSGPTRGDTKGERTRRLILEAAVRQFAAVGMRSASVPAIAREVGLSPSAVYAYFETKAELFESAVDTDVGNLIEDALPELLAGRFDWDFPAVFRKLLEGLGRHPLAGRVLEGLEDTGAQRLAFLPAEVQLQHGIAHALRSGQADGTIRTDIDPDTMAAGLEAVVISLLISLLQSGGLANAAQARGAISVLDAAIRPPRT